MIMDPKHSPGNIWQEIADIETHPGTKPRAAPNRLGYGSVAANAIRRLARKIERILRKGDK